KYYVLSSFDFSNNNYLFYSMFDIDVFVRMNYYSGSANQLGYLFRKVNEIITGKLSIVKGRNIETKFVKPLFSSKIKKQNEKFDTTYDENFNSYILKVQKNKEEPLPRNLALYINKSKNKEYLSMNDHKDFLINY